MKKGNKIEFSKKIFYIVSILFILVIGYSMALMWRTGDTSGLMYLIPSVSTVFGTSIGFYYNKSKAENKIKLARKYNIDLDKINSIVEDSQEEFEC